LAENFVHLIFCFWYLAAARVQAEGVKGGVALRRIATVISVVAIMLAVIMVAASPVAAQSGSSRGEIAQADQKQGKGKQKQQKQQKQQKKETPSTGGISPTSMALIGLGACMVVGGAVLVRRRTG
jgi:LPXTG-motif cell wall-anchored protein